MVFSYLKNAVERRQVTYPHPHYSRSVLVDGKPVPVKSYEDSPYDLKDLGSPVSIDDQIKAGLTLKPMGARPDNTGLESSLVARNFVQAFNSLADPVVESAPESVLEPIQEPAPEPAPSE